ncbi:MAG: hypothetical protein ACI9QD_000478 [Thermoproteota archaeon]|jgi:uncharacterized protein YyaL (SSP411 family)
MNNLKNEKSTYLQQHMENPVHWYAWGPEALQKAKDENKPLFISIGYSTCHWCHLMGRESFSNEEIAAYLNEHFISIKVDREECPDIDQYYQNAAQLFTGRGGWPLSVFTTPDTKPYFVGTYYPDKPKDGMPSFMEVITQLKDAYETQGEDVLKQATELAEGIEAKPKVTEPVEFDGHFPHPEAIMKAVEPFKDAESGGFGDAPKFPQFSFYEWAIEQMLEGMLDEDQGHYILESLEKMIMGGVFDHTKGGFHRYAVDKNFVVPHFEKMLYDQAGFLSVYTKASLIYSSPLFFDSVIQTLDYLESEMLSEDGYFFSAQDAESEGVEGLYFTYSKNEFDAAIINSDPELEVHLDKFYKWFSITENGNFERQLNIITLSHQYKDEFYQPENWDLVRKVKAALLDDRKDRIPPNTDNKGISSWNFQILTALCDVIQYSKIDVIRNKASNLLEKNLAGLQKSFLKTPEGQDEKFRIIHSTTRDSNISYFEDYVFFAESQLRIYEVTSNPVFLENSIQSINFIMNEFFKDGELKTRSIHFEENEQFGNIHTTPFDMNFKSSFGTFIGLIRKVETIAEVDKISDDLKDTIDLLKHLTLHNPLAAGSALRALTYPREAYRRVEVPASWLQDSKFTQYLPHFSARFCLAYHSREDQKWQVCTVDTCEFSGEGFEEFDNIFSGDTEEKVQTE